MAGAMDAGAEDYLLEAAVGKVFASENAWHVADETIQIHGGVGFMEDAPWAVSESATAPALHAACTHNLLFAACPA